MLYSKGFIQDSKDYGYRPHSVLLGATLPTLTTPNLLPFTKGWIWQADASMCVGMALKRAVQQSLEANGAPDHPMISGDFAYKAGRAAANSGDDPDKAPPLEDNGSQPGLILYATRAAGVRLEAHCPDPSTDPKLLPDGVEPWSIDRINQAPTPDDLVEAYDMKGLEFFEVTSPAGQKKQAIRDCMLRRQPVIFGIFVDSGVNDNRGEVIRKVNLLDPSGGGHMLCAGDASSDDHLIFCNWWRNNAQGIEWGDADGNGRIAWPLIETNVIQAFAVKAVPALLRAA